MLYFLDALYCFFIYYLSVKLFPYTEYSYKVVYMTRNRHIACVKSVFCSGRRSKQRIQGQCIIFEGKIYCHRIFHVKTRKSKIISIRSND